MVGQYRKVSSTLARHTSFLHNSQDTLKVLWLLTTLKIRKYNMESNSHEVKNEEDAIVQSFFVNGSVKWSLPTFE